MNKCRSSHNSVWHTVNAPNYSIIIIITNTIIKKIVNMGAERQLQYLIGFKAIIQIIQNLIILNFYLINEERLIT